MGCHHNVSLLSVPCNLVRLLLQVFDQNRMGSATPMQSPTDTHMTTPGSVANDAEREPSGCGLGLNVDVMVCRAEWYYHVGAYQVHAHLYSFVPCSCPTAINKYALC